MCRTVYVNGEFLPESEAKVSVFDRGFLFADGVYEVSSVLHGRLLENPGHLARLRRSLAMLRMPSPATDEDIVKVQKELIRRNGVDQGVVYLQVTRGAADREFSFPPDTAPTLVMFTQKKTLINSPIAARGIAVVSMEDIRWKNRHIKTVGLLAACLAKQAALDAGADDAWLVERGMVTEGSSNNAYIVTQDARLQTRNLSNDILHGITRASVLRLASEQGISVLEQPFTIEDAYAAKEAFITSASTFVCPVVRIDDRPIGTGEPGPIARRLREIYIESALARAGE